MHILQTLSSQFKGTRKLHVSRRFSRLVCIFCQIRKTEKKFQRWVLSSAYRQCLFVQDGCSLGNLLENVIYTKKLSVYLYIKMRALCIDQNDVLSDRQPQLSTK